MGPLSLFRLCVGSSQSYTKGLKIVDGAVFRKFRGNSEFDQSHAALRARGPLGARALAGFGRFSFAPKWDS